MCDADGCDKQKHGLKPYCRMHLARLKRTGTLGGFKEIYNYEKICQAENCNKQYTRKDSQLCEEHYQERRVGIRQKQTERLRYYDQYLDMDYDDLWEWVKKEVA